MSRTKEMGTDASYRPFMPSGVFGEDEIVHERDGLDDLVSYRRKGDTPPAHALITEQQFQRFLAAETTEHGAALVERIEPVIGVGGDVTGYVASVRRDGTLVRVHGATVIRVLRRVAAESEMWLAQERAA